MDLRGGGAANEQRDAETLALHLRGNIAHLVEAGGNQAGETDDAGVHLARLVEDLGGGHHHAHVDHFVVVALQDTPTMFLPMSWTSPFTVAMTILPLD